MSITICNHDICTGCAACRDICPRQCISMQPDDLDALHPVINESICIECGLCEKSCPNNHQQTFYLPQKVWAAWSNDEDVRHKSASGGVAYELYRHWINKGGVATGVVYDREKGCHFILIEHERDIAPTQNSKYTFSDTSGIYLEIRKKLLDRIPVLFIGVPCQIAGLYGFLKKDFDNLTTVDLICHGMPPASYLEQHIRQIEKQSKELVCELQFRDPKYNTNTFTFTLKNNLGKEFYNKKVLSNDNYQLGYHRALIYRENCYSCKYAQKERIADLTIGDFSGLGRFSSFEYDKRNVSCILQNTEKGKKLLNELTSELSLYERPVREAFDIEKQLKAPSIKHPGRTTFEHIYQKTHDYSLSSNIALKQEKRKATKQRIFNDLKKLVYNILVFLHIKSR